MSLELSDTTNKVILRQGYYKDSWLILTITIVLQLGLIVACSGFILHQINTKPKPILFQVTKNKQVIKPTALDDATMNAAVILNWSIEAMRVAYSFNYHSLQDHLAKITPYFDQRGLTKFFAVLAEDPNIQQVRVERLIVSIRAREAPKVIKEGKVAGRYAWRVLLPMSVRYENATVLRRQDLDIDLYIWRVPETESPLGIKITNLQTEIKQGYVPHAVRKI